MADFTKTRFILGCVTAGSCCEGADVGLQPGVVASEVSKDREHAPGASEAEVHPFPKLLFQEAPSCRAGAKSLCSATAGSWLVDLNFAVAWKKL